MGSDGGRQRSYAEFWLYVGPYPVAACWLSTLVLAFGDGDSDLWASIAIVSAPIGAVVAVLSSVWRNRLSPELAQRLGLVGAIWIGTYGPVAVAVAVSIVGLVAVGTLVFGLVMLLAAWLISSRRPLEWPTGTAFVAGACGGAGMVGPFDLVEGLTGAGHPVFAWVPAACFAVYGACTTLAVAAAERGDATA